MTVMHVTPLLVATNTVYHFAHCTVAVQLFFLSYYCVSKWK